MTIAQEQISALIDRIYEAALAPDQWQTALLETGQAIGATAGSVLWAMGAGTKLLRYAGGNLDADVMNEYQSYYITICPRMRMSLSLQAGEVFDDLAVRARPSAVEREYYEFADRHGYDFARILLAERSPELRVGFNFYGPIREDTREEEERLLRVLAPHVRRASHLTLRMA